MGDKIIQSSSGKGNVFNVIKDNGKQNIHVKFRGKPKTNNSLQSQMKQLEQLVQQLLDKAKPEQSELIKNHHEHLMEQCLKKEPSKDLMHISAKGLIEAAETCGKLVKPIAACVKEILMFFT